MGDLWWNYNSQQSVTSLFPPSVLQFVPQSVDIRLCTFSEQIQKGLTLALYEVRRLRQESENFTVQVMVIL